MTVKRRLFAVILSILTAVSMTGTMLTAAQAEPGCSATFSPDLTLHIPVVMVGGDSYTVDFAYAGTTPDGLLGLTLTNAQPTTQVCNLPAELMADTSITLSIPSLLVGPDDYDLSMDYDSTVTSAGMAAAADNGGNPVSRASAKSTSYWKNLQISRNQNVWKGTSSCTYVHTLVGDIGVAKFTWTTNVHNVTFVYSSSTNPLPGSTSFTSRWNLYKGDLYYRWQMSLSDGIVGESNKQPHVKLGASNGGYLSIQADLIAPLVPSPTYYSGDGPPASLPPYDVTITNGDPNFPPITVTSPNTLSNDWFPVPSYIQSQSSDPNVIMAAGLVMPADGSDTMTCSWWFEFYPYH